MSLNKLNVNHEGKEKPLKVLPAGTCAKDQEKTAQAGVCSSSKRERKRKKLRKITASRREESNKKSQGTEKLFFFFCRRCDK